MFLPLKVLERAISIPHEHSPGSAPNVPFGEAFPCKLEQSALQPRPDTRFHKSPKIASNQQEEDDEETEEEEELGEDEMTEERFWLPSSSPLCSAVEGFQCFGLDSVSPRELRLERIRIVPSLDLYNPLLRIRKDFSSSLSASSCSGWEKSVVAVFLTFLWLCAIIGLWLSFWPDSAPVASVPASLPSFPTSVSSIGSREPPILNPERQQHTTSLPAVTSPFSLSAMPSSFVSRAQRSSPPAIWRQLSGSLEQTETNENRNKEERNERVEAVEAKTNMHKITKKLEKTKHEESTTMKMTAEESKTEKRSTDVFEPSEHAELFSYLERQRDLQSRSGYGRCLPCYERGCQPLSLCKACPLCRSSQPY